MAIKNAEKNSSKKFHSVISLTNFNQLINQWHVSRAMDEVWFGLFSF